MRRLLLAPALLAALVVVMPAQAEPGRVFKDTIHLDDVNEIDGFCETDLVVRSHFVADIRVTAMPRGRDGLIYFANRLSITETFTNVANGKSVVSTVNGIDKDLRRSAVQPVICGPLPAARRAAAARSGTARTRRWSGGRR